MVKIGRVLAGICVVVLAVASAASAEKGHQKDPQQHLEMLTKKLELTDQQHSQVESIMTDYRARLESLKNQIEALRGQMEALQKEKREKINAVLSSEQQEKYQKIKPHKAGHDRSKKSKD